MIKKRVKTSYNKEWAKSTTKLQKQRQIYKWQWHGQDMEIRVDKVEILQLRQMDVIILAKVDKSYKVSNFHEMTKKKRVTLI